MTNVIFYQSEHHFTLAPTGILLASVNF